MNYRLFKLITLLFIAFAVFINSKKAFSASNSLKDHHKATISVKTGRASNWYTINPGESVQLIAPQQHKTVHIARNIYTTPFSFAVCLKCFNFFTGTGKKSHFDFQKSLLFPFHVFW